MKPSTWLLWGGPFALLGVTAGALGVVAMRRRRQGTAGAAPLSDAEHERARALLAGDGGVATLAAAGASPQPTARAEPGATASPSR